MIQFIIDNKAVLLGALLGISEVMALIPAVKSNGIFDLILNLLKKSAVKEPV